MAKQMTEEQIYEEARKRVEAKRGFYSHLVIYVIINIFLVLIWWFASGGGFPWFIFPLGGWGIGLLFHGLGVFFFDRRTNKAAIEREAEKIKRELS